MKPKALDLFCCAGGASEGLRQAGFDVTGCDITLHRRYPFAFIHADALTVDLAPYDFVWASPPCQGYTEMRHAPGTRGAPKLIDAVRRRMPKNALWCIENVEGARRAMNNPTMLCGSMFGLGAQGCQLQRHRLFECNFSLPVVRCEHTQQPVIGVYGGHARRRAASAGGRTSIDQWRGGHITAASTAMGIGWMTLKELSEAIPPAYARFVGVAAMKIIKARK